MNQPRSRPRRSNRITGTKGLVASGGGRDRLGADCRLTRLGRVRSPADRMARAMVGRARGGGSSASWGTEIARETARGGRGTLGFCRAICRRQALYRRWWWDRSGPIWACSRPCGPCSALPPSSTYGPFCNCAAHIGP